MYPTSAEYKKAIRRNHKKMLLAEIYTAGGNQKIMDIYPTDGYVTVDQKSNSRRTMELTLAAPRPTVITTNIPITYATLYLTYATYNALAAGAPTYGQAAISTESITTVIDAGLVPDNVTDALTPYGNEIELEIGVEVEKRTAYNYKQLYAAFADYNTLGTSYPTYGQVRKLATIENDYEMIPVGRFVITSVTITESDGGVVIQVSGEDRSLRVRRSKYIDIYQIAANTNAATALTTMLQDRWTDIKLSFTDTPAILPATFLGGDTSTDPWVDAQRIAQGIGMALYFDADGVCRLDSIRDYMNVTPDAEYEDGELNTIMDVTRTISVNDTYNAVIVAGEGSANTGDIYRVEAYDDDPDSPTYRYGGYGVVPYFYSSSLITTSAQAATTAASILNQVRGATEEISWSAITDPSLDAGDVVRVVNEGTKTDQILVLDSITIPLQHDSPMSARARLVRSSTGGTIV